MYNTSYLMNVYIMSICYDKKSVIRDCYTFNSNLHEVHQITYASNAGAQNSRQLLLSK
jgi:hypothetical protein